APTPSWSGGGRSPAPTTSSATSRTPAPPWSTTATSWPTRTSMAAWSAAGTPGSSRSSWRRSPRRWTGGRGGAPARGQTGGVRAGAGIPGREAEEDGADLYRGSRVGQLEHGEGPRRAGPAADPVRRGVHRQEGGPAAGDRPGLHPPADRGGEPGVVADALRGA